MTHWLTTADRLRRARQAEEEFLMRDWVNRSIIGPMLLDRLAADLRDGRYYLSDPDMTSMQSMTPPSDEG